MKKDLLLSLICLLFVLSPTETLSKEQINAYRDKILAGPYGSSPITDVIQSLTEIPGGPEIHQIFQTLAVRKKEALPIVKEKLRTGSMWEKHMLTKLLRYSPWPEVHNELIDLARDTNEHWLPRQGALYALGELGDSSAGPEILPILSEPNCPRGVQLVAISTLARIGYRQAASAISFFTKHEDVHIRLFAHRALAEFGEPVDRQFLLSALDDQNYIVRQEACGALAAVEGEDITQRLQSMARHDFHESVRTAAKIGLIDRQIRGQTPAEKLRILRNALEPAERRTAPWIIQTILKKCGPEGRAFVEQLSLRDDRIGERARAFLIAREDVLSISSSDQGIQSSGEIEPLHASTPTHQTLMEYAVSKAASLETPLGFTSTQQTKMREGTYDEDHKGPRDCWVGLYPLRPIQHGYRPIDNGMFPNPCPGSIASMTARDAAYDRWSLMTTAYFSGQLDGDDGVGAWHFLGRVSHLLQDMSSPLHTFARGHAGIPIIDLAHPEARACQFEKYWGDSDSTLRSILNSIGGPLHSGAPLPSEATAKLDSFTQERLLYRYNNNCPQKNSDDVRGWVEVLAWVTYFRATFWGQVTFGSSGSSGPATSSQTTGTTFDDGYVGAKTNTLNTMFNGNVWWIAAWDDNYYSISDRQGYIFIWMSWTDIDDWCSCGRTEKGAGGWASGHVDSSIRIPSNKDDDDRGVRITGRFWFDTRELGRSGSGNYNRRCYPNKYPNGDSMTDDLHLYYGKYGYPLTVRYNAGLLGLANRRVTVNTNYGQANGFTWSRKDNFGNGPTFNATSSGSYFYFVAKSSVDLTAPQTNTDGQSFVRWLKDGSSFSTSRTITINTSSGQIPPAGVIYTAEYCVVPSAPTGVSATDGTYCDRVQVSWGSVSGATGYEVWRNTTNNSGSASKIADDDASPYDDTSATLGVTYYYWVKAKNSCGTSGFSGSDSGYRATVPSAPTGISATDGTYCDRVQVSWGSVSGATGYEVWRNTTNNSGSASKIADDDASPYDDTSATSGVTYYYWVKAKNSCGTSGFSGSDSGYRATVPSAPTGVSATDGTYCDRVQMSWNPVSGATMYEIWRNTTNNSGSASYLGDDGASPYDDYTATAGVTYYYWVKAKNSCGTSGFSSSDAAYRASAPVITQHPQNTTVYVGQNTDFSVVATGSAPLHYQWKKNGGNVGTDNSTLTLSNVQLSDSGAQITCDVSNTCGTATSNPATLTVLSVKYNITASAGSNGTVEPNGVFDANLGQDVTFTAEPSPGYAVDEWYLDENLVQTSGTTYVLGNIQSSHNIHVTFRMASKDMYLISQSRSVSASNDKGASDSKSASDFGHFNDSASVSWGQYSATGVQDSTITANRITASGYSNDQGPFYHYEDYYQNSSSSFEVVFVLDTPQQFTLTGSLDAYGDFGGTCSGDYLAAVTLMYQGNTIFSAEKNGWDGYVDWEPLEIDEVITLNPGVYTLSISATAEGWYFPHSSEIPGVGGSGFADFNIEFATRDTIYVDVNSPNDPGTGTIDDPFRKIQYGIDAAFDGTTVIVAEGRYYENININGKNIILTGTDPNDPCVVENTIIDGTQSGSVVTFAGTEDTNFLLTGFTITNGMPSWPESGPDFCGGGILGYGTHATISKCAIINNRLPQNLAYGEGGGIYNCDGLIADCIISNNIGAWEGPGGGLARCDGTIRNCTITNNHCQWSYGVGGGGLYGCNGIISGCVIAGNSEHGGSEDGGRGGGLSHCDGLISDCIIVNNRVYSYNPDFSSNRGGGLWQCNGTITNCTIVGNLVEDNGGVGGHSGGGMANCSGTITNCIIWNNDAPVGPQLYSSSDPNYSCIQDWTGGGIGNINNDPCFVNPDNNDFHLRSDSLCIDAGDPNYPIDINEFDIDGDARVIGGRIDIGADEYAFGELSDFSGDGIVNFRDFAILAYYWVDALCTEPDWCEGCDYDQNGTVDLEDLKRFTENWLWQAN